MIKFILISSLAMIFAGCQTIDGSISISRGPVSVTAGPGHVGIGFQSNR